MDLNSHNESPPQFGLCRPDIDYQSRPGAYGVAFDSLSRVAVIEINGYYHLPGGGFEAEENAEEALRREMAEEIGFDFEILFPLGRANQFIYSPQYGHHYNKQCHYFHIRLTERTGQSPEHVLHWRSLEEVVAAMNHQSHVWAVVNALRGKEG